MHCWSSEHSFYAKFQSLNSKFLSLVFEVYTIARHGVYIWSIHHRTFFCLIVQIVYHYFHEILRKLLLILDAEGEVQTITFFENITDIRTWNQSPAHLLSCCHTALAQLLVRYYCPGKVGFNHLNHNLTATYQPGRKSLIEWHRTLSWSLFFNTLIPFRWKCRK